MKQNLHQYLKVVLSIAIGIALFLTGAFCGYFISENKAAIHQNTEPEPEADRQQSYDNLKEQYPVFNLVTNGDYLLPPEMYVKEACRKNKYAVVVEVTKGCEETIKPEIVRRMWLTSPEVEKDYTTEDITEILRQDPRRLYWGENCDTMQIRIEQDIYGNWTGPEELEVRVRPVHVTYEDFPRLKAYTGMRLVLFLYEAPRNGEVTRFVDLYFPFFITEEEQIVPACTLLIGYKDYGGMKLEEFVKEVHETWETMQNEDTKE